MQVAYDRKIKVFSSKSLSAITSLSSSLPDDASFIYNGALTPKHAKRLLKVKNLHSVVITGIESANYLQETMNDEVERLNLKELNRVSRSRGKFLSESQEDNSPKSPANKIQRNYKVYIRLDDTSTEESVLKIMSQMKDNFQNIEVSGLWGTGTSSFELIQSLKRQIKAPKLKVAIPFEGSNKSFEWFKSLGDGRGSIMWTFEYE
mmetsp:Transcript_16012/g.23756  ORF Transcript_16012/g.23756 Transcript_16012/m.23756 type:complete len:205 (+) Transcript_16012:339-953(+)